MSNTNYPGAIDSPYDPLTTDTLASAPHHTQHGFANDAIVQVETKLGTGSSTPSNNTVLSGNGAGSSQWASSLTSFPLTTPKITTGLYDANGNTMTAFSPTASAVDYLQLANASTGGTPVISAQGSDSNIGITVQTKGTGNFNVKGRQDGWVDLSGYGTFSYNANNGNKEFVVNTPVNLTSMLSPGMKLSIGRSVTPPSQCMSFSSASSQYATKATPAGITFTGNFTTEAWVYLNSYTNQIQAIIGRYDNVSTVAGFGLQLGANGYPQAFYLNGSGATSIGAAQSIPLKRWVHIAASVTVASKTINIYINGALVATQAAFASAATSLVQLSTNLSVGAYGDGVTNTFFDGYISEARIWSVAQTQTAIQSNMAINLTGSESNLVCLFQGNGNFNDSTSNANNLTATNGASATQSGNPYNATEYGIITKVTSSTINVFTGNSNTIPNQTLNSPYYSTAGTPYGFPRGKGNWAAEFINFTNSSQSSPSTNTWYNIGSQQIGVPSGAWNLVAEAQLQSNYSSLSMTKFGFSTTTNSVTEIRTLGAVVGAANSFPSSKVYTSEPLNLSSQTIYYFNESTDQAAASSISINNDGGSTVLRAECGYL